MSTPEPFEMQLGDEGFEAGFVFIRKNNLRVTSSDISVVAFTIEEPRVTLTAKSLGTSAVKIYSDGNVEPLVDLAVTVSPAET